MKNKKRKIISNIAFYALILIMGIFIFVNAFMPTKVIQVFGFQGMPVLTPSMEPVIKAKNDYIIVTQTDVDKLKKDDIISFYTYLPTIDGGFSRQIVTHYIYEVNEDQDGRFFVTYSEMTDVNGDKIIDEWENSDGPVIIRDDDIIGKYQFKIPLLGGLIIFVQGIFKSPIMILLVILNITIFVVLFKYIFSKPKKDDEK